MRELGENDITLTLSEPYIELKYKDYFKYDCSYAGNLLYEAICDSAVCHRKQRGLLRKLYYTVIKNIYFKT
jgi:hypothetical protein